VVCTVDSNGQSAAECEANAMLIAAAPELLAALEMAVRRLEVLEAAHYHGDTEAIRAARAAIAKAKEARDEQ